MVRLLALLLLTGCAGPSRARLQELLSEARHANREHVRMLREYQRPVYRRMLNCYQDLALGEIVCVRRINPAQAFGAAEGGLGGFK